MKSLIIALSLLLTYAPIVNAEETSGNDFGIETEVETLVNDISDVAADASQSVQNEVGEIVILEGAGDVAIAEYAPNPKVTVEENGKDIISNAESLPEKLEEVTPEIPLEIQSDTETVVSPEEVKDNNITNVATDVVLIEEAESANEAPQPDSSAETNEPEENTAIQEVVTDTESETEISESSENSAVPQAENITPTEITAEPVVIKEDVATSETPAVVEEETEDDDKTKEEYEEEISYYIKNMNLSVEQLDMAKYISSDSRLKMDQLLKSIYLLRAQARKLEA
ncbi:MAG: hypothetical protein MJ212_05105, partial [Alphaproteobacteria bacterium]|nr:hypothetical protein [Alphaproteobacteria bacterium]